MGMVSAIRERIDISHSPVALWSRCRITGLQNSRQFIAARIFYNWQGWFFQLACAGDGRAGIFRHCEVLWCHRVGVAPNVWLSVDSVVITVDDFSTSVMGLIFRTGSLLS